ncbi:hypothetical protein Tco_1311456 [Tanacetum coccineum]
MDPTSLIGTDNLRLVLSTEDKEQTFLEHPILLHQLHNGTTRTKAMFPRMPEQNSADVREFTLASRTTGKGDQEIDEPQSDINPIRRSTRTRHPTDRLCLYIDTEEHELGDLGEPANYRAALRELNQEMVVR